MELGTFLMFLSLMLFAILLVVQLLKTKVRIKSMRVSRKELEELKNDKNVKMVFFHPFCDSSFFKRDKVSLVTHIEPTVDGEPFLGKILLKPTGQSGEPISRELNYSVYRLTKNDLETILNHFPGTDVASFLFEPFPHAESDGRLFIAFKIFPENQKGEQLVRELSSVGRITTTADTRLNTRIGDSYDTGLNTLRDDGDYLVMKPSPPASSSLSYRQ